MPTFVATLTVTIKAADYDAATAIAGHHRTMIATSESPVANVIVVDVEQIADDEPSVGTVKLTRGAFVQETRYTSHIDRIDPIGQPFEWDDDDYDAAIIGPVTAWGDFTHLVRVDIALNVGRYSTFYLAQLEEQ